MLTRREMLKLSLIAGASIIAPFGGRSGYALGQMMGGGASSPSVAPFRVPLPIPPVLSPTLSDSTVDYYSMTMQPAQVEIIPGTKTVVWGYNGIFPGPTMRVRSGRKIVVRCYNGLPENAVVHLHGGHVPAASDGHPTDYISPGSYKDYVYPNNQAAAALWYHDHTMELTAAHVYKGLAGFYIIEDDFESSLPLPKGANDVPLLIQDRSFNSDGSLRYSNSGGMMGGMGGMGGMMDSAFFGDTILVNGAVQPYFQVGTRKVRFRILNGSNARSYRLALSSGKTFIQIGTDGGLLPTPINRSSITVYPGERVDLIIDFSVYPVGTQVILKNSASSGRTGDVMRFDIVRREADDSSVPSALRPLETLSKNSAVAARNFTLSNQGGIWVINGSGFNPAVVGASPKLGSVEIWRFINQSGMTHPMHIHDVMFQVLDVNRTAISSTSPYYGLKDTVQVPAWGEVRVIAKFTDYLGLYVFHCHILEHEDRAMMAQFQVTA